MSVSRSKKRILGKIVLSLFLFLLTVAGLAYTLRFKTAEWYLDGNKQSRDIVISEMMKRADPVIERELHMTIPQTIFSFVTSRRGEGARERDALKDVGAFGELSFKNRWLRFRDVHRLASLNGFDLRGSDLALLWSRGGAEDVLVAFRVDFLKRQASGVLVNEKCGFLAELRSYVEKRAKEK